MKYLMVLTLLLMTASFSESLTLKDYMDMRNKANKTANSLSLSYIFGIGKGLALANDMFQDTYGKRLYCPSDKLVLNAWNYKRILDDAIEKSKDTEFFKTYQGADVLNILLLSELQDMFPCANK